MHYVSKISHPKVYLLYDSTYKIIQNMQNYRNRKQTLVPRGWGEPKGLLQRSNVREYFEVIELPDIRIMKVIVELHVFVKHIEQYTIIHFTICKKKVKFQKIFKKLLKRLINVKINMQQSTGNLNQVTFIPYKQCYNKMTRN